MAKSYSKRPPQNALTAAVAVLSVTSSILSFISASKVASTSALIPTRSTLGRIISTSNPHASSSFVDPRTKETTHRSSPHTDVLSVNMSTDVASIENELLKQIEMSNDWFSDSSILATGRFSDFHSDADDGSGGDDIMFPPTPTSALVTSTEVVHPTPFETEACCTNRVLTNHVDTSKQGYQRERTTADYRPIGTLQTTRMWHERRANSPEPTTSQETRRVKVNETQNSVETEWSSYPKPEVKLTAIGQADPVGLASPEDLTLTVLQRRIDSEKSHNAAFDDNVSSDVGAAGIADPRPTGSQRQRGMHFISTS